MSFVSCSSAKHPFIFVRTINGFMGDNESSFKHFYYQSWKVKLRSLTISTVKIETLSSLTVIRPSQRGEF